ncbi:BspA family leucine-rich repeat surface protein [Helicobacter labetoulli]|uniref:BspA family leucine-rich repeat surface protein n=1 Tax=Helicobacter labetoulli TaxID=2315333 RepID=UPI000EF72798|nr:BspA family leucine-rich repeat surface protein [Helicobacter labetoulli]
MKYKPQTKEELKELVADESIHLGDIDTTHITDMSHLFEDSIRKDFSGIEKWNVSNVENMKNMFYNATNFNQPLNSWNVESVTSMSSMFDGATSFNQPLDSWNVRNVDYMSDMFKGAKSFKQDILSWKNWKLDKPTIKEHEMLNESPAYEIAINKEETKSYTRRKR